MILNFILKDKTIIPYEKITFKKRGKYYNNVRVSNIDKVECKCDICMDFLRQIIGILNQDQKTESIDINIGKIN